VTGYNNISEEITKNRVVPYRSYFGLKRQLESQLLSRKTKILIYKTLARPVLTYAEET